MELEFDTADVFTSQRFGGNPLAVVHGAEELASGQMQAIAREFNLAETVFVLPPRRPGTEAFLRIFTPGLELPFAGHPNVGCAAILARRRNLAADTLVLDQAAGPVAACLQRDTSGAVAGAEIEAPQPFRAGPGLDLAAVAACLGLPATALGGALVAGCGTPFVLAELVDAGLLAAASPDAAAFRATVPTSLATGIMLHAASSPGLRVARMFAPLAGVPEDPATGSAAVALAGLLLERSGEDRLALAVTQGVEMGRPSTLALRAWRSPDGIRAAVGGGVVPVTRGVLTA